MHVCFIAVLKIKLREIERMKKYEELELIVCTFPKDDIVRTSEPDKEDVQDDVFFTNK